MCRLVKTVVGLLLLSGLSSCAAEWSQSQADGLSGDLSIVNRHVLANSGGYGDDAKASYGRKSTTSSSGSKLKKKLKKVNKTKAKKVKKVKCVPNKALGKKCKKAKKKSKKTKLNHGLTTRPGKQGKPKKAKAAASSAEASALSVDTATETSAATSDVTDQLPPDTSSDVQDDGSALVVFSTESEGTLADAGGDGAPAAVSAVVADDGDLPAPVVEQTLDTWAVRG